MKKIQNYLYKVLIMIRITMGILMVGHNFFLNLFVTLIVFLEKCVVEPTTTKAYFLRSTTSLIPTKQLLALPKTFIEKFTS